MSSYSYQDLNTRLAVVEDKIDFVMKQFQIQKQERSFLDPTHVRVTTKSLLDVYREMKSGLLEVATDLATDASTAVEAEETSNVPAI